MHRKDRRDGPDQLRQEYVQSFALGEGVAAATAVTTTTPATIPTTTTTAAATGWWMVSRQLEDALDGLEVPLLGAVSDALVAQPHLLVQPLLGVHRRPVEAFIHHREKYKQENGTVKIELLYN